MILLKTYNDKGLHKYYVNNFSKIENGRVKVLISISGAECTIVNKDNPELHVTKTFNLDKLIGLDGAFKVMPFSEVNTSSSEYLQDIMNMRADSKNIDVTQDENYATVELKDVVIDGVTQKILYADMAVNTFNELVSSDVLNIGLVGISVSQDMGNCIKVDVKTLHAIGYDACTIGTVDEAVTG